MNRSYFEVNLLSVLVLCVLLMQNYVPRSGNAKAKLLNKMIFLIVLSILSDMIYYALEGKLYRGAIACSYLSMCVYFVSSTISSYYWLTYVYSELHREAPFPRALRRIACIPLLALVCLVFLSPATQLIFGIDQNNVYFRGVLYPLQPVLSYIYIAAIPFLSLRQYSREVLRERKRSCLVLCGCSLLPLAGGLIQILWYGINTAMPAIVVAIVTLYIDNLKLQITLDGATRMNNRGQFNRFLSAKIQAPVRSGLYLIFLDIDHFKSINDAFGHVEGDRAILTIATILKTAFASSNAFLARYGGDEFAVIIDAEEMAVLAYLRKIDEALKEHSRNLPYEFSVSSGYALYDPGRMREADDLVREADAQMYRKKREAAGMPAKAREI